MQPNKTIVIKFNDFEISHQFQKVWIFTENYQRKIKHYEIHSPLAARLIIEEEQKILQYVLINALVKSGPKGDIDVLTTLNYDYAIKEKSYYNAEQLEEALIMHKLLSEKEKLGLNLDEVVMQQRYRTIVALNKVLKIKIPYAQGGGF